MASYSPQLLKRLAGNGISLVNRNLRILVGSGVKGAAGLPLLNSLKKVFPELTHAERKQVFDLAKQSRNAADLSEAARFRRGPADAAVPYVEGLQFPSRARGRIRYQLEARVQNSGRGRSSRVYLNVYSNQALSGQALLTRAQEVLSDKIGSSQYLRSLRLRETAEVTEINILSVVGRS